MPDLRLCGAVVVYRLFDVGYAIDLGRALELLASSAPERVRPLRGEAQALQIRNPPVTVLLGTEALLVGGRPQTVELSARIFDFGVESLRVRATTPDDLTSLLASCQPPASCPFWVPDDPPSGRATIRFLPLSASQPAAQLPSR